MTIKNNHFDIIIVGAGIVGLTLAHSLARTNARVLIIDSQPLPTASTELLTQYDHRVSAITLASKSILMHLGVWDAVARLQAFNKIELFDANLKPALTFKSQEIGEPCLGFIVENKILRSALAHQLPIPHLQKKLLKLQHKEKSIQLTTADGEDYSAQLVIAADGANSWVRKQTAIKTQTIAYGETAIVGTIKTELPHQYCARQFFLETGPLAFLPLNDPHQQSIVWTLPAAEAQAMLQLSAVEFCENLSTLSNHQVGNVVAIEKRHAFPLQKLTVDHYISDRLVLVGDAAHAVHPLAGQGVNMGLLDAAALFDVLETAMLKRRNFASHVTLRQYERWRRADNLPLLQGIDLLKYFWQLPNAPRRNALKILQKTPFIKSIFTLHAVGQRLNLPSLAKPKL